MRNLNLRIISFKRSPDEPEWLYALNDKGEYKLGSYYYNRDLGRFAAIQQILHRDQLQLSHPIVEASTRADLGLPTIPPSFVKAYYESNKEIKNIQLRLP